MTAGGRHRAPSRIATALAQGRYSTTSTLSVAASGGILASSVLVATTQPQDHLQAAMAALEPVLSAEVAGAAPDTPMTEADTLSVAADALSPAAAALALPGNVQTFTQRIDRPVQAVAAPADADVAPMGELGFVGVTPVVEEPEPVAAVEESTAAADAPSQDRTETTASRSTARSTAPAAAPEPAPKPAPAPAPAPAPEPAPAPAPAPSGGAETAIGWAYNHLGLPYIYGSASGGGFDCSGFVKAAYAAAGVSLPHGSSAQYSATSRVSLDNIQRGDLLFYSQGSGIYHVAIYLGDGQVIHSLRDWSGGFSGSKVTGMHYSPGLFAAGRP
nr:C40 family peptidase [Ornithinimicrobium cryptoxanthini]